MVVAQRGGNHVLAAHTAPGLSGHIPIDVNLQAVIERFIRTIGAEPEPTVWTADPNMILNNSWARLQR
jgi:hypothetical protein